MPESTDGDGDLDPTIRRARELRRNSTGPERHLWSALRAHRLAAWKFRRQHPIGDYFVDFYCRAVRLVIELDGASHIDRGDYDRRREAELLGRGLTVLRFSNDEVLADLESVVEAILAELQRLSRKNRQ